jgi:hypothetical protein
MDTTFANAQNIIINTPSLQQTVTFTPAATHTPQTIFAVFVKPPMMEEVAPGNTTVVFLFVRWADITPNPQRGDGIQINSFTYNIENVEVDRVGGAVLRLGRYI